MKGQAAIIPAIASLIFIAVFILVGMVVYGYTSEATPHDDLKFNESICTTCVARTLYTLDYYPALNGSTLVCSNASGTTALVWDTANTSLGYHLTETDRRYINLTQNGLSASNYENVRCDYTYDWATITGQDEFWDSTTASSFAGFALVSVALIVIASVAIIGIVLMMRG